MAQQQKKHSQELRLVSVVWFNVLPPLFGGQKGVALFNEYLGRLVPLYCLCAKSNKEIPASYTIETTLPTGKTQFFNPLAWRQIHLFCRRHKATHLVLEFHYHGIAGFIAKKLLGVKLVVHAHNVEFLRFREQEKWWWKLLYWLEKWTLTGADAVFFKTEKDRQMAEVAFGKKMRSGCILPYGIVNEKQPEAHAAKKLIYQRYNLPPGAKMLLFAGTLDYGPNAAAVAAIEKKLLPLLQQKKMDFVVLFCGRIVLPEFSYLKDLQRTGFIYAGNVPDIENYFSAADVFLNPVITGGGVQTKVVDAVRAGLNVVCFEGMTDGILGADKKLFLVPKNDWTAYANAVVKAAASRTPTPPVFFEQHDWTNIAAKAYQELLNL